MRVKITLLKEILFSGLFREHWPKGTFLFGEILSETEGSIIFLPYEFERKYRIPKEMILIDILEDGED